MSAMGMREVGPRMGPVSRPPMMFGGGMTGPLAMLRQEMDRLFEDAIGGFGMPMAGTRGWPSVELTEGEKELRATFEVPGVSEGDLEVMLDDGDLVVRGEKRSETEDKERRFSERFYGRFERRIPLGGEVDQDGIRAEFKDGVLSVTLPRSTQAEERTRRIPVSTG